VSRLARAWARPVGDRAAARTAWCLAAIGAVLVACTLSFTAGAQLGRQCALDGCTTTRTTTQVVIP
jgi:hypothetical protein